MNTDQLSLFSAIQSAKKLSLEIPSMPSIVRYIDDFTEKAHSFADFTESNWQLFDSGSSVNIRFESFATDDKLQWLLKVFAAHLIVRATPSVARLYIDGLGKLKPSDLITLLRESSRKC
jgi:hypothetical protein